MRNGRINLMQLKYKIKHISRAVAFVLIAVLFTFGIGNLSKQQEVYALVDGIDFVVAKTSLRQASARLNEEGGYLYAYESSYNQTWQENALGEYVYNAENDTYYFIEDFSLCDGMGNLGGKTHIKVVISAETTYIIPLANNRYTKAYNHGYNYTLFPDYVKNNTDGNYILYNNQYYKLVFYSDINIFQDDKITPANTWDEARYLVLNENNDIVITGSTDRYSFENGKFVINNTAGRYIYHDASNSGVGEFYEIILKSHVNVLDEFNEPAQGLGRIDCWNNAIFVSHPEGDILVEKNQSSPLHTMRYSAKPSEEFVVDGNGKYINQSGTYFEIIEGTNGNCFKYLGGNFSPVSEYLNSTHIRVNFNGNLKYLEVYPSTQTRYKKVYDTYFYDIFKAQSTTDGIPTAMTAFRFNDSSYRIKSADSKSVYIPTYFTANELDKLYYKTKEKTNLEINGEYYKPVFDEVIVNTADRSKSIPTTPFITLNNYKAKTNLENNLSVTENVENLYLSFGDIYLPNRNEFNKYITNLTVSATLTNKYTNSTTGLPIVLNPVVRQQSILLPDNEIRNEFWYQYLDVTNLEYYITGDTSGKTAPIINPEGLYTFTFNGFYRLGSIYQSFMYTYSFYLSNTEQAVEYPLFNENVLESVQQERLTNLQYPTFYYNFQTLEPPVYTFDASKYNTSITKTINQTTNTITTQFKTIRRNYQAVIPVPNLIANEIGIITYSLNNTPYERVKISAEAREYDISNPLDKTSILDFAGVQKSGLEDLIFVDGDNVKMFVYTYIYRKANISSTNYLANDYGEFYQKLTTVVFINQDDLTSTTTIINYKSNDVNSTQDFSFFSANDIIEKERIIESITLTESTENNIKTITTNSTYEYYLGLEKNNPFDGQPSTAYNSKEENIFNFKTTRLNGVDLVVDSKIISSTNTLSNQVNFKDYRSVENNYFDQNGKSQFYFNADIILEDLGVYNIINKYNLSTSFKNATSDNDFSGIQDYAINTYAYVYNLRKDFKKEGIEETYPYQKNGYTLHVFGVKSYFKKNGKTEFKNASENIYSNVTHEVMKSNPSFNENSVGITLENVSGRNYPISNIPVTNMPPVSFDYLCSYAFQPDKVLPESKIYQYNFVYDNLGNPYIVGAPKTSHFIKDDFLSSNGYYEIILKYKYTAYNQVNEEKYFYQVFAFIIDNSSPSVKFEKLVTMQDENNNDYNIWSTLNKAGFTNSDVRITWNKTTYFQYDVQPNIQKSNFSGIVVGVHGSSVYNGAAAPSNSFNTHDISYNYNDETKYILASSGAKITYKKFVNSHVYEVPELTLKVYENESKGNIINSISNLYPSSFRNSNLVNEIEDYITTGYYLEYSVDKYIMQMIIPKTNVDGPVDYWGSGNYSIRLNYGSDGKSYLTQGFSIDALDINGIKIAPVDINAITKVLSAKSFVQERLIAEPFTFMYNRKGSGAGITTTYTAIPFSSISNIDLINLNNNLTGVLASHFVNGTSPSVQISNSYPYDYSFYNAGDTVYLSNIFTPSTSMLYIFNLKDSAGNTAEFYVFYDKSNPNFFVDLENENNYLQNYNVITGLATVSWGNYKAIEVVGEIDNEFVFGDKIDHNSSKLSNLLKNMYLQPANYSNSIIVPVWELTSGQLIQAEVRTENIGGYNKGSLIYYTDGVNAYIDEGFTKQINKQGGNLVIKYYVLMPIDNVNFEYYNTNGSNNDMKSFNYSRTTSSPISKNSTVLAPTIATLAINAGVSESEIRNDTSHLYGFYGENKYIYTITDIMGNESGNTLWMNLDLSLAFAYGNFINTNNTLSRTMAIPNLEQLTPFNSYSTSQLYFSYLQEPFSPQTKVDYKFYNFDFEFFSDYIVSNLAYNDSIFTLTFVKKDDASKTKIITINRKSLGNINDDGDDVLESLPMFPFSLIPSAETASWKGIEKNNYLNTSDPYRVYSTIINPTFEQNESGTETYVKSAPGLYVFRRTYTDYINSTNGRVLSSISDLENQTAYKFYVYIVDRNGIINLTSLYGDALDLENLNMLLGAGINEESYGTTISEQMIFNRAISNLANTNASYSSMTVNNLLLTNKMIVQLNLSMDKYNQPKFYRNFLDNNEDIFTFQNINTLMQALPPELYSTSPDPSQTQKDAVTYFYKMLQNFMFGISNDVSNQEGFNASKYYNQQFLIRLELKFGNSYTIIGNKEGSHNIINPNKDNSSQFLLHSLNSRPQKTSATHREQLNDGILLNINNKNYDNYCYGVNITDSSGITEGSNKSLWNKFANSIQFNFGINANFPSGSFFGKYKSSSYASDSANSFEEYANILFDLDITPDKLENTLEDLNTGSIGSFVELYDTNNDSLIFVFDKTTNQYFAEINPYNISITRTLPNGTISNIFNLTQNTNGSLSFNTANSPNSSSRMANAFINNSSAVDNDPLATSWAVVIFDAKSQLYESMRLSQHDLNASYTVSINFKGLPTDYIDIESKQYYTAKYSITIDRVKPLYNLIQLMEQDKYIVKQSYNYPAGHLNIKDYYNEVLANNPSELYIQNELKNIYNYYANFYLITDEAGNPVKFDNKTNASLIHNYFFAVDENFTFRKLQPNNNTSRSNFDTFDRIYFRKIDIDEISNYKFSLTRDDYDFATEGHPLFNAESVQQITSNIREGSYYYFDFIKPNNPFFTPNDLSLTPGGYYEIIERDEAGNFRVYAIYYAEETPYNYSYSRAIGSTSNQSTSGQLSSIKPTVDIYGNNLLLTCNALTTKDLFLSANIEYSYNINSTNVKSGTPIRIVLDPISKKLNINLNGNAVQLSTLNIDLSEHTLAQYTQVFLDAIKSVYTAITTNNENINDFVISITFFNRTGGNYKINYYVPGQEVKYIRTGNEISIPADSEYIATRIMRFEVYQYRLGAWQTETLDFNRKAIVNGNGTYSLGGSKYVFRNGTFRFVLTDNFGRTSTYYESFDTAGTISQRLDYSGDTKQLNNITYTGKPVVMVYNPARYTAVVYSKIENQDWVLLTDITSEYKGMIDGKTIFTINSRDTIENGSTTSRLTLTVEHGYHVEFRILILNIEDLSKDYTEEYFNEFKDLIEHYEYKFVIYTKLPTVQLRNLNGVLISHNNGQSYIEDIIVIWNEKYTDGKTFDFNAKIELKHIQDGKVHTQTIPNNYQISPGGNYILTITNDLGYTFGSINFSKVEADTAFLYKIFSRQIINGQQLELMESKYSYMSSQLDGVQPGKVIYNYYALSNFNNYIYSTNSPNTTKDHIFIIPNTNHSISAALIKLPNAEHTNPFAIYEIYSGSGTNKYIMRYVKINFVPKSTSNFSNMEVRSNDITDGINSYTKINLVSHIVKTSFDEIVLTFNLKDESDKLIGYNKAKGNEIYVTHWYNGLEVEKIAISKLPANLPNLNGFSLALKESGYHKIAITDLAGNISNFMGVPYLNIYIINSIIYQINNDAPIMNQVFNSTVNLEVITRLETTMLYDNNDYSIIVYRNGEEYNPQSYVGINHKYSFTESGYYEVKFSAYVSISGGLREEISNTYTFRIVNPRTTVSTFSVSSANNFKLISLSKKVDMSETASYVSLPITSNNELWISAEDPKIGAGYYRVVMEAYISSIKQTRQFAFEVWISSTYPTITANIPFGTETTNVIVLSFNPFTIFQTIGEGRVVINGEVINNINAESQNEVMTISLYIKNEYWVEILTDEGKVVASYKLIKNDPLNTNAKIAIIISSVAVVSLAVVFFVLRRKRRFR